VFSYELAAHPDTPASKYYINRTSSYEAVDELTTLWKGIPGFVDNQYPSRFWNPLPEHLLSGKPPISLLEDPAAAETPLGWGPFIIQEWIKGSHITLTRNQNYFRASEGLPKVDTLVYRFLSTTPEENMTALLSGECDVLDQTALLSLSPQTVTDLQAAGEIKALTSTANYVEELFLGIRPFSYENGYDQFRGDRPDYFADNRVRRAIAMCINREAINQKLLGGLTSIPATFYPPDHQLMDSSLLTVPYDPASGIQLLEEAGWVDPDKDPLTPRVSTTAKNILRNTPFLLNYATTDNSLRKSIALMVSMDLSQCGIGVNLQFLPQEELFAAGPSGKVFGRQFDLVEFYWETGIIPQCSLYTTGSIPFPDLWLGTNITGYSSSEFDNACAAASVSPSGTDDFLQSHKDIQRLFFEDMPAIPLFAEFRMAAARKDLCGLSMDPSSRSELWNIEETVYGADCPSE
jgi:peptide/nickel transport system substrate-binding protein